MKKIISSAVAIVSAVGIAGAQLSAPTVVNSNNGNSGNIGQSLVNLLGTTNVLLQMIYGMAFTIGLLVFFFGLIKYLMPGSAGAGKKEGLEYMGFGILTLFVMVGIWGLVGFISGNLGVGIGGDIPTPGIPGRARVF